MSLDGWFSKTMDDILSVNPLAMKSGDKIIHDKPNHRPPPTSKIPISCKNSGHKKQIDKIGDIQIYLIGRNSAPDMNIEQFRFCPYCGKKLNA